jgi:hypothetical protein
MEPASGAGCWPGFSVFCANLCFPCNWLLVTSVFPGWVVIGFVLFSWVSGLFTVFFLAF